MAWYLDTSALVKLIVAEPETETLRAWLIEQEQPLVSSDLTRAELMRATRRAAPDQVHRVREVLDVLILVAAPAAIFEAAGRLAPDTLRSLDAIHLASALDLGDDLDGQVTYDERLAAAARSYGLSVVVPGVD